MTGDAYRRQSAWEDPIPKHSTTELDLIAATPFRIRARQ
jgi:hypothetical protein